jgi:molybdenum cofactor cytidylyltransferase
MRFRSVPLGEALGPILGHNIFERNGPQSGSEGSRRVLKKGQLVTAEMLERLAASRIGEIYVAQLDPDDIEENAAARRIGHALAQSSGLRFEAAHGGRASLRAPGRGVLSIDAECLLELNLIAGVTLATRPSHQVLQPAEHAGTLKVIPFALPEQRVVAAVRIAERGVLAFRALEPRRVQILVCGFEGLGERLVETYRRALVARLVEWGMPEPSLRFVALGGDPEPRLAAAIEQYSRAGVDVLLVVGETATMDADDLIPQAIRRAGGDVQVLGAPVFPGNLLLLAYRGACAIVGAPGCARSRAQNVIDLLLPRLLTGERPGPREIAALGLGGLLKGAQHEGEHAS